MNQTEICNMAASRIGAKGIGIITENTPTAIRCLALWDGLWEFFLTQAAWRFARKVQALALNTTAPTIDFAYSYNLPSDCKKPLKIGLDGDDMDSPVITGREYEVVGNQIHTDVDDALLLYTYKVTNTELMPPWCVNAFAYLLASDLAVPVSGSKKVSNVADRMEKKYADALNIAMAIDAAQVNNPPPKPATYSPWLNARS